MLQMSEVQSHFEHLQRETQYMWTMRRQTQDSVCVDKRKADVTIVLNCSNCKGDYCTACAKYPYRREMIQRKMPVKQTQSRQTAHPVKSVWTTIRPISRQSTHTIHHQMTNQFQVLPQMLSMNDFPDTLHLLQTSTSNKQVPSSFIKPYSQNMQCVRSPTPQTKRNHSGDWRQIVRKPANRQHQRVAAP